MSTRQRRQRSSTTTTRTASPPPSPQTASSLLLHWNDLPAWLQDNAHIHTGYRSQSNSFRTSYASLLYLHNESLNIYTHLIPALLIAPAAYNLYGLLASRYPSATATDVTVFTAFFIGAATCLGMSATYHTISNHSLRVAKIGNGLDYVGIVGLITGSFVPSVYYGFYCQHTLQMVYWSMIVSLGIVCTVISVDVRFRTPAWRPFRAAMFVAMGLSALFPVLHGLYLFGLSAMTKRIGLPWLVTQGALYILGAGIYAARVPEKWRPGGFDIVGSSHQIFHVLVVLAAMTHLRGLVVAFDFWHSAPGYGSCE